MGGDGGSIPGRQDLVRLKQKKKTAEKNEELAATWRHCALSQNPLRLPIVACEKGKLYNKEAILEHLLEKTDHDVVAHVKTLKDVKELKLTPNPSSTWKKSDVVGGGEYVDVNDAAFICPVIGLEMNGRWRFLFYWGCGCVLSEKARLELKSDKCHKCGKPVSDADVVILNGTPEDATLLEQRSKVRKEKAKEEKRIKKKRTMEQSNGASTSAIVKEEVDNDVAADVADSNDVKPTPRNPIEEAIALARARSDVEDLKAKRVKESKGKELKSKESSKKSKKSSVQDDPNKSEIYKSLFTSHKDAQNQERAHWVTMNPGYFR